MPIRYQVDRESGVIFEEWSGVVTRDELEHYWQKFLADPDVLRLQTTLVDLTAAEIAFSGEDLFRAVLGFVEEPAVITQWRSAFLVATELQFGVATQFIQIAASYVVAEIFEDAGEAMAWLAKLP